MVPRAEARHLLAVLRRQTGDRVVVIGDGRSFGGTVFAVEPELVIDVDEELESAPIVPWTVGVALVKGNGMEIAVRQASELGLERIVPLSCERSEVKESSARPERWRRIAAESAKQCGRAEALRIDDVEIPLAAVTKLAGIGGPALLCEPGAPALDPALLLQRGRLCPALFLIGPEGGFSPDEIERLTSAGARPVGFPGPVLRSPTAVVLVAALAQALLAVAGPGRLGPREAAEVPESD